MNLFKQKMNLFLISYPQFFNGEVQIINSLFEKYDFTFHLRKPEGSLEEHIQFLNDIPDKFHQRIMLHNHYNIANRFNLKGLHFSTKNRKLAEGYKGTLKSTSCHSLNEAKETDGAFDYQFLSPIYPSISKEGYIGNLNIDEIKIYLKSQIKCQVVALGGIDSTKINELKNWGFDGAALLGAVWGKCPELNKKIEHNIINVLRKSS